MQQVFIALDLDVANEVRVDHDDTWDIREARHRALSVLEGFLDMVFIRGLIGLEEVGLRLHRRE